MKINSSAVSIAVNKKDYKKTRGIVFVQVWISFVEDCFGCRDWFGREIKQSSTKDIQWFDGHLYYLKVRK
jgi:hypothetical protein